MSIIELNPYINFNGNAEAAIKFYETVSPGASHTHVILHFDDVEEMTQRFDALGVGARIELALHDSPR